MVLDRKSLFGCALLTGLIFCGPSVLPDSNIARAEESTTTEASTMEEPMPGSDSKMDKMDKMDEHEMDEMGEHEMKESTPGSDSKMEEMSEMAGHEMKKSMPGSDSKMNEMDEMGEHEMKEAMPGSDSKMDDEMTSGSMGSDTKGMDAMKSEMSVMSDGKININAATPNDLYALPGVGPSLAARIVLYRDANGAFESIEDLSKIKGINSRVLELVRDKLFAGPLGDAWVQESPVEESEPEPIIETSDEPTTGTEVEADDGSTTKTKDEPAASESAEAPAESK